MKSAFKTRIERSLEDESLQRALKRMKTGFQIKREKAIAAYPPFAELKQRATEIRKHTLTHLDRYLVEFERKVVASGGQVHWASTAQEANRIVAGICRDAGAEKVIKSKSMITEETDLNAHLNGKGFQVIETDLGEYIIQLRGEKPSHIIAPAIHIHKEQVAQTFRSHHDLGSDRPLDHKEDLLAEARKVLREHFLSADVGITGANFLVAETGSVVLVTNEGNGDLCQVLPKVHIAMTSIEKVVPDLADTSTLLRVLARSATGQPLSVYTTFATGPKQPGDPDGPESFHVVLLDNGRSEMLAGPLADALRCIRCGSCMNYCPVYGAIGGHAYGWVYPGPIGSILTPALAGLNQHWELPHASSFCGRCDEVCPVGIPLSGLLREWRDRSHEQHLGSRGFRMGLSAWSFLARRPALYRLMTGWAAWCMRLFSRGKGRLKKAPFAGGWTEHRDLPSPTGSTFFKQWRGKRRP